ncbi:MAG TPA: AAA family ATPase [Verrucomicrobiae bacterium]|jgi:hypothetical protein|nr:AAA family ATPase [Verrucomicrobiae bacterium]
METEIEPSQRLRELAEQARSYQLERQWTDAQICREIAHLGSTKTFRRILDPEDVLDELNIKAQLRSYESAIELIGVKRSKDIPPEPEYEDFRNIVAVRKAVTAALKEETIARFVCVEGENGTGKDASLKAMLRNWPKITVACEADELWRESLSVPLADIINSLGLKRHREEGGEAFQMPNFPAQRRDIILEELNRRKIILAINEAHSMGPRSLNTFKMLINKTPTVVVFFCIPVLLNRLIESGYEEAAQLFGNRLCRRVRLESPAPDEILTLSERRGVQFESSADANEFAKRLESESPSYGNWSFVRRAVRKIIRGSDGRAVGVASLADCINDAKRDCIDQQMPGRASK